MTSQSSSRAITEAGNVVVGDWHLTEEHFEDNGLVDQSLPELDGGTLSKGDGVAMGSEYKPKGIWTAAAWSQLDGQDLVLTPGVDWHEEMSIEQACEYVGVIIKEEMDGKFDVWRAVPEVRDLISTLARGKITLSVLPLMAQRRGSGG